MICPPPLLPTRVFCSSSKLIFKTLLKKMKTYPGFVYVLMRGITAPAWVLALALQTWPAFGQASNTTAPSSDAAKVVPAKPKSASQVKSGWSLLTSAQQQALQPLAKSWGSLSQGQQRKWLEISRNYPSLSATDKSKMHSRMSEWAALSPRARAEARLNFATTNELSKELSPQEKQAKWQTYQSLSAEEKQKLSQAGVRPPVGAALPARPVAQKKLATLPLPDPVVKAPKIVSPPVALGPAVAPTE